MPPFHLSDVQIKNCISPIGLQFNEQNQDQNKNIEMKNEKAQILNSENIIDLNGVHKRPNLIGSVGSNENKLSDESPKRKIYLQFSEPVSKQVYNTNSSFYDERCRHNSIITMTFPDLIPKKTTIFIKMFDSLTNKLIAELPLPLNIIPFDKKVSSKFRMINKFDENSEQTSSSSLNQTNNLIDFDIFDQTTPKNPKTKKNVTKIKLFLMIHLSTFGQLPFHAQKGTLLKHLKDATRIKVKSFGGKKDEKNKSLSLNNIIKPTASASLASELSGKATTKHEENSDLITISQTSPNLKVSLSSNSTDYSENNEDSSSEVVETLFIDNTSDLNQPEKQINEQENQLVFIDDNIKMSPHKHSHHHKNHTPSGHSHHHDHKHHHHNKSNHIINQMQLNHLSDDQNELKIFDDKRKRNVLLKVGSCSDIPVQCLLTDVLVK